MAASLLKKGEFRQVGHLCSIILNYNPENVKALFRRATAAIGLGNFELACWDLKLAHGIEPSNQEVVRKLGEVAQFVQNSPQKNLDEGRDKKKECREMVFENDTMKKKEASIHEEGKGIVSNEIGDCKMMDFESSEGNSKEDESNQVKEISIPKGVQMSERMKNNKGKVKECRKNPNLVEPKYHFYKKESPQSSLNISKKDYRSLAQGRTIQHYNPRSGVTMSIRIIGTSQETPRKSSKSEDQSLAPSPPIQQCDLFNQNEIDDTITHSSDVQNAGDFSMEISQPEPEEIKIVHVSGDTSKFHNCSSRDMPLLRSPTCFHSITTAIRSPSRRIKNQFLQTGAMKKRRVKHRKFTCVLSNPVFQCRSKVAAEVEHYTYRPPSSQILSKYQSGMKRKSIFLQSPDSPHQPRKLVIVTNDICNSCLINVCNLSLQLDNSAGCMNCVRI